MTPATSTAGILALSSKQIAEVNKLLLEEFGFGFGVLLENAGRAFATLTRHMLGGKLMGKQVIVLVGAGNSGACGLVAARILHSNGANVLVILARSDEAFNAIATHQLRTLNKCGVTTTFIKDLAALRLVETMQNSDLVLDAMVGRGLKGTLRQAETYAVQVVKQSGCRVLALDLPTGLPAEPGTDIPEPLVLAQATLALGLPLLAHTNPAAEPLLGNLYLADIGIPTAVYKQIGLTVGPLFASGELLQLRKRNP
jgi:NAD(P)H-hydrate epimerase